MEKSAEAFRTISEVSDLLDTPAHVLRFWESRFPQVRPVKRAGGRRYYRPTDVALLSGIKKLLHADGLTIRGVQKVLREHGIRHVMALADAELAGEAAVEQTAPEAPPAPPNRVISFRDAATRSEPPEVAEPDVTETETDDDAAEMDALPDARQPLQLTDLIAEAVESSVSAEEVEVDALSSAAELPLFASAEPAPPAAPPPATDDGDAADGAEPPPRGAWIATELRRLTSDMAGPYSAEFNALGRRLEALRDRQSAATGPRKG